MSRFVKVDKSDRCLYYGTFAGTSSRYNKYKKKIEYFYIVNDVRDQYGNYMAKFVPFYDIKSFSDLHLQPGDVVSFRARFTICQDERDAIYGFINTQTNVYYRLMNPTKVTKLYSPVRSLYGYIPTSKIQIIPTKK